MTVIGVGRATDFNVTYDLNRTHVKQIDDIGITAFCLSGGKEAPLTVADGPKIAGSNPSNLFIAVSSFSPIPEVIENASINVAKGFLEHTWR